MMKVCWPFKAFIIRLQVIGKKVLIITFIILLHHGLMKKSSAYFADFKMVSVIYNSKIIILNFIYILWSFKSLNLSKYLLVLSVTDFTLDAFV